VNHASGGWRIRKFHGMAEPAQAHAGNDTILFLVEPDRAPHERDLETFLARLAGLLSLRH
jgi:hypothetical protein